MDVMFPNEWLCVTGSEFVLDPKADIVDGPFGSNLKSSEYVDSGVPIARIQNVKRFRFIDKNIKFLTHHKAAQLHRHSFVNGDILITKLGEPLGLACEVPEKFSHGIIVADLVRLRPVQQFCAKPFLIYLLNSEVVIKQIESHVKGTTRPRINLGVIRGLNLPLPPLAEQKVIADKLDTLLGQVDNTKARLERIPEILKSFRQSVLAAAVSGKLTEEWRGDSSYCEMKLNLEKAAKSIDIPTTWLEITLSDSCKVVSGNAFKSQDFLNEGQVPAIKISNVQYGQFEIKNQQFL